MHDFPVHFYGIVNIQPDQIAAVGHDGFNGTVSQVEDTLNQFLLHFPYLAVFLSLLYQCLYFVFRHLGFFDIAHAQDHKKPPGTFGQQPYEGIRDLAQHFHETRHGTGHLIGSHQPYPFGNQFPYDQCEICHKRDDQYIGNPVCVWLKGFPTGQDGRKFIG